MKCNKFWQKNCMVKPNKWQTSLFQPLKAFNRITEIKPIPILLSISLTANYHFWYCRSFFALDLMYSSTGYVIKQLVHAFSCALSSYGALGKFGEHSSQLLRFFRALQTCRVLHNSIVHAKAWRGTIIRDGDRKRAPFLVLVLAPWYGTIFLF